MKALRRKMITLFLNTYVFISRRAVPEKDNLGTIHPRNVVVFSTTALGDFLMNTPAIYSLRSRFPCASFTLVSSEKNMSLVKQYGWFENIIQWDNKIMRILPLIRKLRRIKPDLCVILHAHYPYDVMAALISNASIVIRDNYGNTPADLNPLLHAWSGEFNGHTIARKLKLIRVLGADDTLSRMHLPSRYQKPVTNRRPVRIGFQLGASREARRWPTARFCQLAIALTEHYPDVEIVITGSRAEQSLEKDFCDGVPPEVRNRIRRYAGKTQLDELVTLIMSLDVLVTGDTGPMHIAIAAGIRTVSLFAKANPLHTGPFQAPHLHRVIHQPPASKEVHPMTGISPEIVLAAVTSSMESMK